jgi:hypothetical protein
MMRFMYMITLFVVLTTSVCEAEWKCKQTNGWPHPSRFPYCEDLSPNATRGLLETERDTAIRSLNEYQAKLKEAQALVKKYQARERRCECSGVTRTWYDEVKDVVSAPISELITNLGDMTPLKLFVVSIMTLSGATMVNLTISTFVRSFRG